MGSPIGPLCLMTDENLPENARDSLSSVLAMEADNVAISRKYLGSSYEIVQRFDDAYDDLGKRFSKNSGNDDEQHALGVVILLLQVARRECLMSASACLKGYRGDAYVSLRRAIEASASAHKVGRKFPLAKVWLEGGQNAQRYKRYRNKFETNLFPDNHACLLRLKSYYEWASRVVHPSIFAVSSNIRTEGESTQFSLRDMPSEEQMVRTLLYMLEAHHAILQVFGDTTKQWMDAVSWTLYLSSLEVKLIMVKKQWVHIQPARPNEKMTRDWS
jgi:hypothetical protein